MVGLLVSVQHRDQLRRSILAGAVSCISLLDGVLTTRSLHWLVSRLRQRS
jgi:hypothetical protein